MDRFDMVNPLLNVVYTTGESGPIHRCDIVSPMAPLPLCEHQSVEVLYEGVIYQAMSSTWNPPVQEPLTGVHAPIMVLYETECTWSIVQRDDLTPIVPALVALYDHIKAKYNSRFLPAIALASWRPGRVQVSG